MGDVYRAHDARLGRDVALKVLPAGVATDPERLARFRREARAVAALNHPHIVTIFSIEDADGVPFMTMELVEGRSLEQALAEGGLSLPRFFDIVAVAAGQLGRTADARAALDAISERYASYLEPARVRALWSMWQWDADLVDRLLQGFSKALALVDRPGMRNADVP